MAWTNHHQLEIFLGHQLMIVESPALLIFPDIRDYGCNHLARVEHGWTTAERLSKVMRIDLFDDYDHNPSAIELYRA